MMRSSLVASILMHYEGHLVTSSTPSQMSDRAVRSSSQMTGPTRISTMTETRGMTKAKTFMATSSRYTCLKRNTGSV